MLEHELEVAFECIDVCDLVAREVWAEHVAAVRPALSVGVEDAMAEEG